MPGHPGEPTSAPNLAPGRGPLAWELPAAGQAEQEVDPLARPAPDYEFDRRVVWQGGKDQDCRWSRDGLGLPARVLLGRVRFLNAILV